MSCDRPDYLLVTLMPPAGVVLSPHKPPKRLILGGILSEVAGWPPWASLPGLLLQEDARAFIGLSFSVSPKDYSYVGALCRHLDPHVVRYCKPGEGWRQHRDVDKENVYVEVLWGSGEPDGEIEATLSETHCYYSIEGVGGAMLSRIAPFVPRLYFKDVMNDLATRAWAAVGVMELQWILEAFELNLPSAYRVPAIHQQLTATEFTP